MNPKLLVLISLSLSVLMPPANSADGPKPNVILILSDDLGWSDIGCYGGEIKTPTLDRLAANGLRFIQFYNSAKCEPTRVSLMSGPPDNMAATRRPPRRDSG